MRRATVAAAIVCLCLTLTAQERDLPPPTLQFKQYEWHGPGDCIVDLFVKTPCRTVRYHEYSFGHDLGFEGTTKSEWLKALDQRGSESNSLTLVRRRWLVFKQRIKRTELVLRGNDHDQILWLDHLSKTYESRTGNRNAVYWEEDDKQCSHAASKAAYLNGRLADSEIAGIHVVGWGGRDTRGAEYEVYFAPSIGCQELRFQMIKRGIFGTVTAKYLMEVDAYILGPPDPRLFRTPSDYRRVQSIVAGQ